MLTHFQPVGKVMPEMTSTHMTTYRRAVGFAAIAAFWAFLIVARVGYLGMWAYRIAGVVLFVGLVAWVVEFARNVRGFFRGMSAGWRGDV
jgi:hypothetical protein